MIDAWQDLISVEALIQMQKNKRTTSYKQNATAYYEFMFSDIYL